MEKQRRIKVLSLCAAIIAVIGLTIAFATLSTTLSVNGMSYLDAAKWGIKFENLSEPSIVGEASVTGAAKIEESKAAEINNINVSLSTPGDSVTYTVDLVNEGDINAKIENIEKTNLTEEQQKYITFTVKYKENDTELKIGDILSKGEVKPLVIKIEYRKDLESSDLPKSAQEINLSYKLDFVQTDDKAETTSGISKACTTFEKKDTYSVGDVIALCNNDTKVSEDFYVISDNGSTVTALAKYNLLVGNVVKWNDDFVAESTTVISSSEEGYGLQNSTAANYESNNGTPSTNTFTGVLGFSKDNNGNGYWVDDTSNHNLLSKYGSSYPAYVFDENSTLYKPLSNYESYIKNTLKKTSVEASLLTYEQVINLGCSKDNGSCKSAASWVHAVNYWIGSVKASYSAEMIGHDMVDPGFGYGGLEENMAGLRPVITISKSEL